MKRPVGSAFRSALLSLPLASWVAGMPAHAGQSPVMFTPDITAQYGTVKPALVDPDEAAVDNGAGSVAIPPPAAAMFAFLPAGAQVADFELSSSPTVGWLFSVDTTVALPGLPATSPLEPRDVARFDPATSTYSIYFDGSANGIPDGARIDAIATDASDRLLLSFDTSVSLPGLGTVDDEDLVRFSAGTWTMEFDGSAHGVTPDLDLDAAHRMHTGNTLLLSFDVSGSVPGVAFDDEDVLAYDTAAATYAMWFDGSLSDPTDWPAADLVGLPEPDFVTSIGIGLLALATLAYERRNRKSRRG